jgi:hypothetical protein
LAISYRGGAKLCSVIERARRIRNEIATRNAPISVGGYVAAAAVEAGERCYGAAAEFNGSPQRFILAMGWI